MRLSYILRIDFEVGHVEVTGNLDKSSFTGMLGTNGGLEQCISMGAEEVEILL